MCGRYSLADLNDVFASRFKVANYLTADSPHYQVAPTQLLPVIIKQGDANLVDLMTWGLIPYWSKELSGGIINARAETVAIKPSFRRAFRFQRCLVPATGFFEWKKSKEGKLPYFIKLKDQE